MRYMGGKQRQSKLLLHYMEKKYPKGGEYCEPFCGALGSAEKLVPHFKSCVLSDSSEPIVVLWNSIMQGWRIPDFVDEDIYKKYAYRRHSPDVQDPMTAWCGYALSFGGKWFGGYARQGANKEAETRRSQTNQKASALRKIEAIKPYVREIIHADYRDMLGSIEQRKVVYLDPPYSSRTKAHHTAKNFDHKLFWDAAAHFSLDNDVYVSEFIAPDDWAPVISWGDTIVRHNGGVGDGTIESLYKRRDAQ